MDNGNFTYNQSIKAGLRPDPFLKVSEWSDEYRMLSQTASAEPGRFRTSRTPYAKRQWQKIRERNEALDCRIYARAAAIALGVDQWPESKWRKISESLMKNSNPATPTKVDADNSKSLSKKKRQRVSRSNFMG